MLKIKKSVCWVAALSFLGLSVHARANSITTPLVSDASTLGLWNFDSDPSSGTPVVDSGPNAISGTAYSAPLVSAGMPGLAGFGAARQFTGTSSFIDLGQTLGSKLDVSGTTSVSVEAYVELAGVPSGIHTIFDNGEVQLVTLTDHLAAFVMQPAGFNGVVANTPLSANVPYRVGLVLSGGVLNIFVNEKSVGSVPIAQPIGQPLTAGTHTFIGGNIYSEYFPGFIDDVRFSNSPRFDLLPPLVTLVSPSQAVSLQTANPTFSFILQDQGEGGMISGVDPSSVQVYLNGRLESGLTVTATSITGVMTDPLLAGSANEVDVVVSDFAGNQTKASYFFTYINGGPGVEYQTDGNTLALWHMDELSQDLMPDSSGNNENGYGRGVALGAGVYGTGRVFSNQPTYCSNYQNGGCGAATGVMAIPVVQITGKQFTVETWVQPNQDLTGTSYEQVLLDTNQIHIARFNNGNVRLVINLTHEQYIVESTSVILPIHQLHHLAITWDGTKYGQNILFYVDGVIQQIFNGPATCDFDFTPRQGYIGTGYNGMLDEMRISSVVRTSFNLIAKSGGVQFGTLTPNSSVSQAYPQVNAAINTSIPVDPSKVHVYLNGHEETSSPGLVISGTAISGTLADAMTPGLNIVQVVLTDQNGNQVIQANPVFYVQNGGGAEYATDAGTVALWHFDDPEGNVLNDSSGKGNDFTVGISAAKTVPGVVGLGRVDTGFSTATGKLTVGTRALTVEGWIKSGPGMPTGNIINMTNQTGEAFGLTLTLNASGDVELYFGTPDGTFDQIIPTVFPFDANNYHHIAVVYDPSRDFSQLLFLVDGVVKAAFNFKVSCDFNGTYNFNLGTLYVSNVIASIDEWRISSVARYSFNLGNGTSAPMIDSEAPLAEATVHSATLPVSYAFHSAQQPISVSGTYLELNGVPQSGLTVTPTGLSGTLTGTITLNPGANSLRLHVKDASSQETDQDFVVYLISQGPATAYVADAKTVLLMHLDETTGTVLADSSSNMTDLTLGTSGVLGGAGVFGTALSASASGPSYSGGITSVQGASQLTIESWLKVPVGGYVTPWAITDSTGSNELTMSYNGVVFNPYSPAGISASIPSTVLNDGAFHHVALIVDSANTLRNVLMTVDGTVIYSNKSPLSNPIFAGNSNLLTSSLFAGAAIDELRISNTARYTMSYSATKKPATILEMAGDWWTRLRADWLGRISP